MTKRIVAAGSKYYEDYAEAKHYIEYCTEHIKEGNTLIFAVCGCGGTEMLAERYANENGYKIERYPTIWETYGTSGGAVRNKQMINLSDLIICFWDGTIGEICSMTIYAEQIGKEVRTLRVNINPHM